MRIPGSRLLAWGAVALLTAAGIPAVQAQTVAYPAKRVTLVVAFAPGGFADTLARIVGQNLQERWGQPVTVANRAGAGGNTAAAAVVGAEPDGYSILVTTTALAINNALYKKLDYALDGLVVAAIPAASPESIAIHPTNPAKNLSEFIAWAKGREITFATAGVGTGSHLAAEYFLKEIAKVNARHVPFRGGSLALQAALGNQVDLVASSFGVMPHVVEGKLTGLAVASASRVSVMPQVPTYAESGFPGFEAASWVGFFFPAKTDRAIVAKLNGAINDFIGDEKTRKPLLDLGYQLSQRSVGESAVLLDAEVKKWGNMVRTLGLSVD
jgi:tripartite-type tricarboxylate transporter receptor subunit TctC